MIAVETGNRTPPTCSSLSPPLAMPPQGLLHSAEAFLKEKCRDGNLCIFTKLRKRSTLVVIHFAGKAAEPP
jgi:hypothetical protein